MKFLIGLLLPLVLGGIINPPSSDVGVQAAQTDNVLIDTDNVVFSQIEAYDVQTSAEYFQSSGVNSIGSDSSLPILGSSFQLVPNRKTIIGFDAPQMSVIDRLTLRIQYFSYEKWDVFKWFPKNLEDNFVISKTGINIIWNFAYFKNATGMSDLTIEQYYALYCPKVIGSYFDLSGFQTLIDGLPKASGYGSLNFIDNPAFGDNVMPLGSSALKDRSFYVILPVYYDVRQVWISVAGTTIDDEYISDGLDEFGEAYTTTIMDVEYKYIDINSSDTSARGVYFNNRSTIHQVQVSGTGLPFLADELKLCFGSFDFETNLFSVLTKEFTITSSSTSLMDVGDDFIVLSDQVAVFAAGLAADIIVRIIYDSTGSAVLTNIIGPDGYELPITNTPDVTTDFDLMIGGWTGIIAIIMVVLRIVLVGLLAFLVAMVIVAIIKSSSKKGDNNKSRRHYRGRR